MKIFWVLLALSFCSLVFSQKTMQGQVIDYDTSIPIAFANITYNNKAITSNWEGKFSIEIQENSKPILFTYKGYYDKSYYQTVGVNFFLIKMVSNNSLKEQEIFSENQVNSILKKVIESKPKNQPEKALTTFEYKNYEQ